MSIPGAAQRSYVRGSFRDCLTLVQPHRKNDMLATISIITGLCAGSLALIQAQKQPEKARQLRLLSLVPFGMAALMVLVFVL